MQKMFWLGLAFLSAPWAQAEIQIINALENVPYQDRPILTDVSQQGIHTASFGLCQKAEFPHVVWIDFQKKLQHLNAVWCATESPMGLNLEGRTPWVPTELTFSEVNDWMRKLRGQVSVPEKLYAAWVGSAFRNTPESQDLSLILDFLTCTENAPSSGETCKLLWKEIDLVPKDATAFLQFVTQLPQGGEGDRSFRMKVVLYLFAAIPRFVDEMSPSFAQIQVLMDLTHQWIKLFDNYVFDHEKDRPLKKLFIKAMEVAQTSAEYATLSEWGYQYFVTHYELDEKFKGKFMDSFFSLNPSVEEILKFGYRMSSLNKEKLTELFERGYAIHSKLEDFLQFAGARLNSGNYMVRKNFLQKYFPTVAPQLSDEQFSVLQQSYRSARLEESRTFSTDYYQNKVNELMNLFESEARRRQQQATLLRDSIREKKRREYSEAFAPLQTAEEYIAVFKKSYEESPDKQTLLESMGAFYQTRPSLEQIDQILSLASSVWIPTQFTLDTLKYLDQYSISSSDELPKIARWGIWSNPHTQKAGRQVIKKLLHEAWSRPLTLDEVDAFLSLIEWIDPEDAKRLLIQRIRNTPSAADLMTFLKAKGRWEEDVVQTAVVEEIHYFFSLRPTQNQVFELVNVLSSRGNKASDLFLAQQLENESDLQSLKLYAEKLRFPSETLWKRVFDQFIHLKGTLSDMKEFAGESYSFRERTLGMFFSHWVKGPKDYVEFFKPTPHLNGALYQEMIAHHHPAEFEGLTSEHIQMLREFYPFKAELSEEFLNLRRLNHQVKLLIRKAKRPL